MQDFKNKDYAKSEVMKKHSDKSIAKTEELIIEDENSKLEIGNDTDKNSVKSSKSHKVHSNKSKHQLSDTDSAKTCSTESSKRSKSITKGTNEPPTLAGNYLKVPIKRTCTTTLVNNQNTKMDHSKITKTLTSFPETNVCGLVCKCDAMTFGSFRKNYQHKNDKISIPALILVDDPDDKHFGMFPNTYKKLLNYTSLENTSDEILNEIKSFLESINSTEYLKTFHEAPKQKPTMYTTPNEIIGSFLSPLKLDSTILDIYTNQFIMFGFSSPEVLATIAEVDLEGMDITDEHKNRILEIVKKISDDHSYWDELITLYNNEKEAKLKLEQEKKRLLEEPSVPELKKKKNYGLRARTRNFLKRATITFSKQEKDDSSSVDSDDSSKRFTMTFKQSNHSLQTEHKKSNLPKSDSEDFQKGSNE